MRNQFRFRNLTYHPVEKCTVPHSKLKMFPHYKRIKVPWPKLWMKCERHSFENKPSSFVFHSQATTTSSSLWVILRRKRHINILSYILCTYTLKSLLYTNTTISCRWPGPIVEASPFIRRTEKNKFMTETGTKGLFFSSAVLFISFISGSFFIQPLRNFKVIIEKERLKFFTGMNLKWSRSLNASLFFAFLIRRFRRSWGLAE